MSEDKQGQPPAEEATSPTNAADAEAGDRAEAEQEQAADWQDEVPERITLDRYLSQRRPPPKPWTHLVAAALMLGMLIAILLYKDRCGMAVSGIMGELQPGQGQTSVPVKVKLAPGPGKSPASAPTSQPNRPDRP